jgi:predicted glycosyltransferase
MFFKRSVEHLRHSGHEVLCTSRQYREAVELARLKKLDLQIVGSHGGADRYGKLRMSADRIYKLADVIHRFRPEVALTFSSPEGARVAYGLGIQHFAFNDSPHSEAVARLTVPLATKLFSPWIIPLSAWTKYGIKKAGIKRYRAIDAAAWIKHESRQMDQPHSPRNVLIRLEESKASYVADRGLGTGSFIDEFVEEYHQTCRISILCRYQDQIDEVEARYGSRVTVIRDVVEGTPLLRSTDLFVGAGGTMTAESALLGKPTISITPFSYHVEKYLIRVGLVKKALTPRALIKTAKTMLDNNKYHLAQGKKAGRLLESMEDPTEIIVQAVNSLRL